MIGGRMASTPLLRFVAIEKSAAASSSAPARCADPSPTILSRLYASAQPMPRGRRITAPAPQSAAGQGSDAALEKKLERSCNEFTPEASIHLFTDDGRAACRRFPGSGPGFLG